ncbi:hypothetical protein K402DRAFT_90575 [Aulographum hederae CBS 113979]|uniref:Uncharacterized protein n=1 Tax=Aulographum hederae CBS 113979 TaxID=1176131 RepID=A0A6G1GZH5_9PEZI|nr:hypothetical protein K402DRAFT_90575 [Aulographum hederae CBS 113979]
MGKIAKIVPRNISYTLSAYPRSEAWNALSVCPHLPTNLRSVWRLPTLGPWLLPLVNRLLRTRTKFWVVGTARVMVPCLAFHLGVGRCTVALLSLPKVYMPFIHGICQCCDQVHEAFPNH